MMSLRLVVGVKVFHPLADGRHNLLGITTTELDASAMTHTVNRMLEILKQHHDWFTRDLYRLLQRTVLHS